MGDDEDGLGWEGLAVDQPWNIDEVDETTGASSLVQDQPGGHQISLPPASSSGSKQVGDVAK